MTAAGYVLVAWAAWGTVRLGRDWASFPGPKDRAVWFVALFWVGLWDIGLPVALALSGVWPCSSGLGS